MSTFDIGILTSPNRGPVSDLSAAEPNDVFEFQLTSTRNINLALTGISAGDDAELLLVRDTNNNGVLDNSDTPITLSTRSSNADEAINVQAQPAGTYFAQVFRFAPGSSGDVRYDLRLSSTPPGPGNTASRSDLLPIEVTVGDLNSDRNFSNRVDNFDTADVFQFSIGAFEGVNISLSGLSNDADIRLIRDFNNNRVVDAIDQIASSTLGGTAVDSINNITDAGNYLLQVYQFRGDTNYQLNFDHFTTTFA